MGTLGLERHDATVEDLVSLNDSRVVVSCVAEKSEKAFSQQAMLHATDDEKAAAEHAGGQGGESFEEASEEAADGWKARVLFEVEAAGRVNRPLSVFSILLREYFVQIGTRTCFLPLSFLLLWPFPRPPPFVLFLPCFLGSGFR